MHTFRRLLKRRKYFFKTCEFFLVVTREDDNPARHLTEKDKTNCFYICIQCGYYKMIFMGTNQCFGSGSVSVLNLSPGSGIPNADPDPAADKISSKSQNNSYHLELFD
jgi:hypothetical protein